MVRPFERHTGGAIVLRRSNIDTDQIIPSREIKTVSKRGLGKGLFASWRYITPTTYVEDPDFALNRPSSHRPTILIAGANFGCGSSREHAVWALQDYGFQCVIAPSFGEIFYNNCIRNGLLPAVLKDDEIDRLVADVPQEAKAFDVTVDLVSRLISIPSKTEGRVFEISENDRHLLLNGLDAIALTETHREEIDQFIAGDKKKRPWAYSYRSHPNTKDLTERDPDTH